MLFESEKLPNLSLKMKLTTLLLIISLFKIHASTYSQSKKITLNVENVTIKEVFYEIEDLSDFRFLYNQNKVDVNRKVSLKAYKKPISDILDSLFEDTDIYFKVKKKQIILKEGKPKEKNNSTASNVIQETITITGTVTEEKTGMPIPGANILEKGTSNGVMTDFDGNYSIEVSEDAVLVVSFIGYASNEIEVNERSEIDIVLETEEAALDEVVVVAYGESSKRNLNSSVSTLDMDKVAPLPVQSVNDGIAGRIDGVIVTSSTGAPGAKSQISIRGGGNPLFVIDDIVRSKNDFENLNPQDIASYSILKDAAATSLYGALGGNGVVLITTKRGKDGQMKINYSFNQIFSEPTIFPERLNSYDNLAAINDVYRLEGREVPTKDSILNFYREQSQPYLYPNTNWRDVAMKDFAPEQRHDLSITSGTDKLTYYGSLSYYDQGTILRTDNNSNDRITYRLNAVNNFDKINIKVTTGIDGFIEKNEVPNSQTAGSYAQIFQHIQQKRSTDLAYNEFGLPSSRGTDNPAVELSPLSGYSRSNSRVFNGLLKFEWEAPFLEGLGARAIGNYNMWNSKNKSWNVSAPTYDDGSTTPIIGGPPDLSATAGEGSSLTMQGFLTYKNTFNKHTVNLTAGYEQTENQSSNLNAIRRQYQIVFDQFVAGPTENQYGSGAEFENARAGYIGRFSYDYDNTYFFDATIRRDGHDLFPPNDRWGIFYAFAGGWIMSEENFMQNLNDRNILNYLKLRGSVGKTGIVDGIGRFQYVSGYNINANTWVVDGRPVQGTSEPGSLPSTNYSWFSIHERNIGLDLATLNNRLSASVDYFYKRTVGYVGPDTKYSDPIGIGLPPINLDDAALRRHGYEFHIDWQDNFSDFEYNLGFNFTYSNQLWERTTDEDEADLKNPYTRVSGTDQSSYGSGYLTNGYYQNNDDLLVGARRINSLDLVAGDLRYRDMNGDGKIDGSDFRRIGSNAFPRINFGATIDLKYKNFFLNTVVMGSGKRDRYLGGIIQGNSAQNKLVYGYQLDYWRPDNKDALFPRAVSSSGVNGNHNFTTSDHWILTSAFLRLKFLQFGYDFDSLLTNTPFNQFRVFLSGTNLLTYSKSKDFFVDPESNQNNEAYPIQRTFALGLNLSF